MKNWTVTYDVNHYSSPMPQQTLEVRATDENHALAAALRRLSYKTTVRRGAIAEALKFGNGPRGIMFGTASGNRNKFIRAEVSA